MLRILTFICILLLSTQVTAADIGGGATIVYTGNQNNKVVQCKDIRDTSMCQISSFRRFHAPLEEVKGFDNDKRFHHHNVCESVFGKGTLTTGYLVGPSRIIAVNCKPQ